jgi:protein-disulfide isomerase
MDTGTPMTTRRSLLLAAAASIATPALAQQRPAQTQGPLTGARLAELMAPSPAPWVERARGSATAPVTVIEYASTTCIHCANFHANVLPAIMTRFVETGRVRWIFRPFALNPLDAAAVILANCSGDNFHAMVDGFFSTQRTWTQAPDPIVPMLQMARQAGFTQESFERCLRDQSALDAVSEVRNRGERFGVRATPTFFIDGQIREGGPRDVAEFESWLPASVRG